jgi:hypothetical protein
MRNNIGCMTKKRILDHRNMVKTKRKASRNVSKLFSGELGCGGPKKGACVDTVKSFDPTESAAKC